MTASSPATPLSLLERICGSDHDSWRRLLVIYEPLVRSCLRQAALQPADCDDLTQQVLTVLIRKLPQFQHNGRPGAFRSWLRSVTLKELSDFFRRRAALPALRDAEALDQLQAPVDELARCWDEEYDRNLLSGLLQLVKDEFTPPTWRAFRRVALEEVSPVEVAGEMGMTVNAVTIAKSRVLRRLRQEVGGLIE
jgi:RNA polymerase sigma-70 factor, ECF subfamily